MIKATTKIAHAVGLHARPAAMVVKLVSSSGEKVTLSKLDQSPVNAASMLSVLSLGLKQGEEVEISIDSDGATELMEQIVSLISTPLDE
jgi:phosphocarrier protein